jgi:hypothetical protein
VEARLSVPGTGTRAQVRARPGTIPAGVSTRLQLDITPRDAALLRSAARRTGRAAVAAVSAAATATGGPPGGPQGTGTVRLTLALGS